MQVKPQFFYFDAYSRGEGIRILLAHAKVDFDDKRVGFQDWPALKKSGILPGNQMPAWLENGVYYNQSKAILRKLAKRYGYESSDHLINWRIDSIVDEAPDHFEKFYGVVSKRQFDDEALKTFLEVVKNLVTFIERIMNTFG